MTKEAPTPKEIAESVWDYWNVQWSGEGLGDNELVEKIVEHIKDMK